MTYGDLDARSNQFAHYLRSIGIGPGGLVAILTDNDPRFYEVGWGARRSGVAFTTVNYELGPETVAHIVRDSGAQLLVAASTLAELTTGLTAEVAPDLQHRLMFDGGVGFDDYETAARSMPTTPVDDETEGDILSYTSGSTGQPSGVWFRAHQSPIGAMADPLVSVAQALGVTEQAVYLAPSPIHHSFPALLSMAMHRLGVTVVLMRTATPQRVLEIIDRHHVTHSLMPPSLFVGLVKLPAASRRAHDVSSVRGVLHTAAPCPPAIKRALINWWGPVISEFYAASDVGGSAFITSAEWLQHPGSVGKPVAGVPHVLDTSQRPLPVNQIGDIWFSDVPITTEIHYSPGHSMQPATEGTTSGLRNTSDVGYLDHDGYLYVVDRRSNVVTFDGNEYYPVRLENTLISHPRVADAAVISNQGRGGRTSLSAAVQPLDDNDDTMLLEEELRQHCRVELPNYPPLSVITFLDELPRAQTGKLYRRLLKDRYFSDQR